MTRHIEERLGVCSWSLPADDPARLTQFIKATGLRCVQLALLPLCENPDVWGDTSRQLTDAGITIASGMLATVGEDYSSIDSIRRTGGVVPDETWPASRALAYQVIDKAAKLNIPLVTFHAGFIPENANHAVYNKVCDRITELANYAARQNIDLALETGQESAQTLNSFLAILDCKNVGVNFDPANMLLYGRGDPVQAVTLLALHLKQVHIKDAKRSAKSNEWGEEVVVGQGDVRWSDFIAALRRHGYSGSFMIEREVGVNPLDDIVAAQMELFRLLE